MHTWGTNRESRYWQAGEQRTATHNRRDHWQERDRWMPQTDTQPTTHTRRREIQRRDTQTTRQSSRRTRKQLELHNQEAEKRISWRQDENLHLHVLVGASSDPSEQSIFVSHTFWSSIHWPSEHLNSRWLQGGAVGDGEAAKSKENKETAKYCWQQTCLSASYTTDTTSHGNVTSAVDHETLRQFSSSDLSPHSSVPSHCLLPSMHRLLVQWNWPDWQAAKTQCLSPQCRDNQRHLVFDYKSLLANHQ